MKRRTALTVIATSLALVLAGGTVGTLAATGAFTDDKLARPGSITVQESSLPDNDLAEQQQLTSLATVSKADAEAAATAAVGSGTVTDSDLDVEGNSVVWQVDVTADDFTEHDVIVDAGNATILRDEVDRDDS